MKGLLLKDIFTLVKQLKIFLAMIVIFSLIPEYSVSSFAVCYSAMLPITAISYEERSKWNKLARMMPYTPQAVVFEKYLLCYIFCIATSVLSFASNLVMGLVNKNIDTQSITNGLLLPMVAIAIFAIVMPFITKLGVEKGRLIFLGAIVLCFGAVFAVGSVLNDGTVTMPKLPSVLIAVAVVLLNVASYFISLKIYKTNK